MMAPPSSGADWYTAWQFLRWADRAVLRVWPRWALFLAWLAQNACKAPLARALGMKVAAVSAADLGDCSRSMALVDEMLATAHAAEPSICHWFLINTAVDVCINAGRYGKALEVHQRWSADAQERGRAAVPLAAAFVHINSAEGLHNLGRDAEALALLAETEDKCRSSPLAIHGLWSLRAWVLAGLGQASAARDVMAKVSRAAFGPRYYAEFHYTHAAIARGLGDHALAWREARLGLRSARRSASRRNGLHLLGSIAAARGDDEGAIGYLQKAETSRYQGQAGPYQLLLGMACERLGRREDAKRAFARAVAWDPESYAAQAARQRL